MPFLGLIRVLGRFRGFFPIRFFGGSIPDPVFFSRDGSATPLKGDRKYSLYNIGINHAAFNIPELNLF